MKKVLITSIISVLIVGLLLWEHFHGGVQSHHLLHREDLPAISNWWSGLLLPILTWILLSRIETRLNQEESQMQQSDNSNIKILRLFLVGLVLGVLLAVSFTNNYKPFLDNLLYLILLLSFVVPIYYAEFILGFILGITYTFGAILPTVFILIMAGVGFLIYRFIRPLVLRLTKLFSK